ncbi:bile acid:sodium symporter family protein [Haloquadratum walsbyi]|jgi:BASS family bile acid:Na+ symporter|uniref:BASS family transport protein n=1 Tax=Haloquadratum walsbyi (strain DSM 16790 / HBSQ001) TaxID=362976 RepID=Q18I62_HALWD|nr:bile acid:sodium symporter family protein [Haloquadratum walsbyi]CAJ52315.1 BASS family transport protein [Haloquadratum walsbyi DSM 16790]
MNVSGGISRAAQVASKYFVVWVIAAAGIALVYPNSFVPVLDYVNPLLGIIMLGMGLTLQPEDFQRLAERPVDVGIGAVTQWLVMPLAAYALYILFDLPDAIGVGLILVGAAPGGTASNVMTFLGRGDVALSVAITTVTTLAAPIVLPAWTLFILEESIDVTFMQMFASIVRIVIIPVVLGFGIRYVLDRYSPKTAEVGVDVFPVISVVAIVAIVAGVVGANVDNILTAGALVLAAVVLHNGVGLGAGYGVGRAFGMSADRVRTTTFEVGLQNSGLAVALAASLFDPAAALIPALFSVWHNVSGPALASYFTWSDNRTTSGPVTAD